ncbi:methyltransferase domain-containing protein [Lichenibacterium minor]|uniref:Methyltransferase domain-containing protein n=1 Tax=Lichenibacterium minor TaxID=2316528 RepID=A0A4Q2UDH8_9HYPH|nr:SAM-dependent methyltransferase [Lichenibacterium minor]RYC32885.1 methyltransferase domain-containing protein [Lichenibacterium minor]
MRRDTLGRDHFEALYAARPDPWRLATSGYERAKHAATLAALPRPRYPRGFEVGCALGTLTTELGRRCGDLLAVEPVAAALAAAAARAADQPHIRFASMFVPGDWPSGVFDLVVLSEVLDYLGAEDVVLLAGRVVGSLERGGDVVMVHWIGKKRGPPSGDEASDRFRAAAGGALDVLRAERNADYRLDVLRKV